MPAAYLKGPMRSAPQSKPDAPAKQVETLSARAALLGWELLQLADGRFRLIDPNGKEEAPVSLMMASATVTRMERQQGAKGPSA